MILSKINIAMHSAECILKSREGPAFDCVAIFCTHCWKVKAINANSAADDDAGAASALAVLGK